jgi:hypothetical protein
LTFKTRGGRNRKE